MALSGLDIYKLLPKTNCRECGFVTCLAFAMQLAKKAVSIDKCPHLSEAAKAALEASSLPPIRLVTIGAHDPKVQVGNETVLFRHEEKFHNPCAIGFVIEDSLPSDEITGKLKKINNFKFERVGQKLNVELIAIKQTAGKDKFISCVKAVSQNSNMALVLMSDDPAALKEALGILKNNPPLIYSATEKNIKELCALSREFNAPLAISAPDLEALSGLTTQAANSGIKDIVIDTGKKGLTGKIWDLTQMRRLALKKSNRSLGYPAIVVIDKKDAYEEAIEAASYISKYASIVLLQGAESWEVLSLLTLRQNIYTDPQKPLQIEPKVYAIGKTTDKSPLLVTTNFSLSYYTVLGEVEASKVPAFIMSVDTEGMSVLTAWAAEKFNAEKVKIAMDKLGAQDSVSHKKIIIPGYVAMMSGDLEEQSGWQVIVGPKEAAGLPSFLKNLQG